MVRSVIEASAKRLSMRKGAEIISVELQVGQEKFVFYTVYRVGTLGKLNHNSIMNYLRSFYSDRAHRSIFIVVDFNLNP